MKYDYIYPSNPFSQVENSTVQKFINHHKIEKVKKSWLHEELNLGEISCHLDCNRILSLSNQFKKITELSSSFYK